MNKTKAIKSQLDVQRMRESCKIASALMNFGMQQTTPDLSEVELSQTVERERKKSLAQEWAFPLIIGSGGRATILHAKPTKRKMKIGEMVLLDLGVKFDGFCSDISRTIPVSGSFSEEMKALYRIVLKAQAEVIRNVQPGRTLLDLHILCQNWLAEGCKSQGVGGWKEVSEIFPHRTSHWIGAKVHDSCDYVNEEGQAVRLEPGMCFTIEPGLYLKNGWKNLGPTGIRIEDVVVVTETSCEVISTSVKEVEEIENWMKSGKLL